MALTQMDRHRLIVEAVRDDGFLTVSDAARRVGVSEMTIRRDAEVLESRGALRRVHGGLVPQTPDGATADGFTIRAAGLWGPKRRVAAAAVGHVGSSDTITIDAGTTCFAVAQALPGTFAGTIITNSIPVLQHGLTLRDASIICLGGQVLVDSQALAGERGTRSMSSLHADTAFIGSSGITTAGLFIHRDLERPIKRKMIANCDRAVAVITEEKIGKTDSVLLTSFAEIDEIITPAPLPKSLAAAAREYNVAVTVAGQLRAQSEHTNSPDGRGAEPDV